MTEEKTDVVLFGEEKLEINEKVLKKSLNYVEKLIR